MTIKELLQEYREVFSGSPWYGDSLLKTLTSISFPLVNFKPRPNVHSIAELLKHLLSWRRFVLEKLDANKEYNIELNSQLDWEDQVDLKTPKEWNTLLEELQTSQENIEAFLLKKEDEWLLQNTSGKNYSNQYMMLGIMHHDIYHLGQIRLIRKLAEERIQTP